MSAENDTSQPVLSAPSSSDQLNGTEQLDKKKKKKKDKLRSVWISFVGRIVAQIMGAVATIFLGLVVLHKYQSPKAEKNPASPAPAQKTVSEPATARMATPGELSLAVL